MFRELSEVELSVIKENIENKTMYITKWNTLDCISNCSECHFYNRCVVGGDKKQVEYITNKLKEYYPEEFI